MSDQPDCPHCGKPLNFDPGTTLLAHLTRRRHEIEDHILGMSQAPKENRSSERFMKKLASQRKLLLKWKAWEDFVRDVTVKP